MEIVGGSLNLELSALCNLTEPYDFGGARRDRTADLNTASVALSQLSYSPTSVLDQHRGAQQYGYVEKLSTAAAPIPNYAILIHGRGLIAHTE